MLQELEFKSKSIDSRMCMAQDGDIKYLCVLIASIAIEIEKKLDEDKISEIVTLQLVHSLRCLRNACISSVANAAAVNNSEVRLLVHCKSILKLYYHSESSSSNGSSKESFVLSIAQFLSNYATNGSKFAVHLWTTGPSGEWDRGELFQDLLACAIKFGNRKSFAACIGAIYLSIRHSDSQGLEILEYFCVHGRSLICQMLLGFIDSSISLEGPDPAMEWIHVWGLYLLQANKLYDVFTLIGNGQSTEVTDGQQIVFTHEQMIFSSILQSIIEDTDVFEIMATFVKDQYAKDQLMEVIKSLCSHLANKLPCFEKMLPHVVSNELNKESIEELLNADAISISMDLLTSLISFVDSTLEASGNGLRETLVTCRIIEFCGIYLQLRQQRKLLTISKDESSQDGSRGNRFVDLDSDASKAITKSILQLLGTIVYNCPVAQVSSIAFFKA